MHKYWRHIGDYAKDTRHLSMLEHGAYTLMLDWCYASERPLPANDQVLFRLCGAFTKQEQTAVLAVRKEFFTQEDDGWTQKRVMEELDDYLDKKDKAAAAADKRWQNERNASAMRTHNERIANGMPRARVPATSNQQPATNDLLLAPGGAELAAESDPVSPDLAGNPKKKKGAADESLCWSPETGWQGFTDELWDELARAYPACDIRRQFLAMEQWLKANQAKARKSNWRKFVTNWLVREQDRGGDLKGRTASQVFVDSFGPKKETVAETQPPAGWQEAARDLYGRIEPWAMLGVGQQSEIRAWLETQQSIA